MQSSQLDEALEPVLYSDMPSISQQLPSLVAFKEGRSVQKFGDWGKDVVETEPQV